MLRPAACLHKQTEEAKHLALLKREILRVVYPRAKRKAQKTLCVEQSFC